MHLPQRCCSPPRGGWGEDLALSIVAMFYPFSQFCEMNISLLSLQKQPNTAPNLFQRGVEYGKYAGGGYGAVTLDDCNFHECVDLEEHACLWRWLRSQSSVHAESDLLLVWSVCSQWTSSRRLAQIPYMLFVVSMVNKLFVGFVPHDTRYVSGRSLEASCTRSARINASAKHCDRGPLYSCLWSLHPSVIAFRQRASLVFHPEVAKPSGK